MIGIDPGLKGGIAWEDHKGAVLCSKMPTDRFEMFEFLRDITMDMKIPHVVMERVWALPGQNVAAMTTFMKHVGHLEMAISALRLPVTEVLPKEWQQFYKFGNSNVRTTKSGQVVKDKTEWKNRLKSKAEKLFPNLNISLATSDALLIYHWGKNNVKY